MTADGLLRDLRRLARNRSWPFEERQGRGSHVVARMNGRRTVIPMHRGEMPTGTYRAILRQLGITARDLED